MDDKVIELLATIKELIVNINNRINDMCDKFKSEGELEQDRLVNLLEDLNVLAEGVAAVESIHVGIDLSEFQEKLNLMENALGKNDLYLFMDIIQFELKDLLEYWVECLTNYKGMPS